MKQPIVRTPTVKAKKGQPLSVKWGKWVEDNLRRVIDRKESRYHLRPAVADRPPLWTTISRVPESDPAEYQVKVELGYLIYQNANAAEAEQGVTGYIVPKIRNTDGDWISMDEVAPVVIPAVPLPALASWVYLRVKTTSDGMPDFEQEDGPVTIEAFDSEQKSIHHVRPSPNGEEAGDYYFLLLETESNGATPTPAPRAKRRITGNRELPNQLIEITNIQEDTEDGEVRELYKGYLPGPDDKHELRTVVQIEAEGEPIIKPLATGEEEGPSIKWKRIKPNQSRGPQINISTEDDGDTIMIQGNGESIEYTDMLGGGLVFKDGLVILKKEPEEGATGANFNIELLNIAITELDGDTYVGDAYSPWDAQRFFYVRNGLLFLNDDGANVDTYEVISRIEGETFAVDGTNQSGTGLVLADPPP